MHDDWFILAGQVITFLGVVVSAAMSIRNSAKIHELHLSVNSRLDELVSVEKGLSFSEGVAKGTIDERLNPLEPKT